MSWTSYKCVVCMSRLFHGMPTGRCDQSCARDRSADVVNEDIARANREYMKQEVRHTIGRETRPESGGEKHVLGIRDGLVGS
jgi:hypothetical protein